MIALLFLIAFLAIAFSAIGGILCSLRVDKLEKRLDRMERP